jgi:TBC1 domain family member 15
MVAIERSPKTDGVGSGGGRQSSALLEEDKYRLVYSKSKVYVNPTAYARDNIPGFVSLVKRVRSTFQLSGQTLIFWL